MNRRDFTSLTATSQQFPVVIVLVLWLMFLPVFPRSSDTARRQLPSTYKLESKIVYEVDTVDVSTPRSIRAVIRKMADASGPTVKGVAVHKSIAWGTEAWWLGKRNQDQNTHRWCCYVRCVFWDHRCVAQL